MLAFQNAQLYRIVHVRDRRVFMGGHASHRQMVDTPVPVYLGTQDQIVERF